MTELQFSVTLLPNEAVHNVSINGQRATNAETTIQLSQTEEPNVFTANINGSSIPVFVKSDGVSSVIVSIRGYQYSARVLASDHHTLFEIINASPAAKNRTVKIKTPMPGLLKHVFVKDGDVVKKGDALFTLEAMKMENAIVAPAGGTVKDVQAVEGQAFEKGAGLCEIVPIS